MALTAKQKLFVQEYLVDLNATQAAIRSGYSERTAAETGYDNLRKPQIAQAIEKAMGKREKRTEITQDRVLQELARIGFADIKNFLSFRTEKQMNGVTDEGEAVYEYKDVIEMRPSDQVDGAVISEVKYTRDGIAFKLHDKVSALDKIGKHLGMWKDKVEVTGGLNHTAQDIGGLTPEERRARIDELLKRGGGNGTPYTPGGGTAG